MARCSWGLVIGVLVGVSTVSGCGANRRCTGCGVEDPSAHLAHDAYVTAINSNDLDTIMEILTDDVVFMAPNTPRLVGKQAVREWAQPYLEAYKIHWDKTSLEFIVVGDWAFEQYAYIERDVARDGSGPLNDTGKGINIYHRDSDGVWRVARDAWNSDLPME